MHITLADSGLEILIGQLPVSTDFSAVAYNRLAQFDRVSRGSTVEATLACFVVRLLFALTEIDGLAATAVWR